MAQSIQYTARLSTHKTTIKDNDTLQEKLAKKLMSSGGFPPPPLNVRMGGGKGAMIDGMEG